MTLLIARSLLAASALTFIACSGDVDTADTDGDTMRITSSDSANIHGAVTIDTASPSTAAGSTLRKINLNTATNEELHSIPGIGDKMVHEFEEYRPYRSLTQFRKEIGKYVDAAKVAEYELHVFVPVDPNESDAATMQQIPGLDATKAEQLIAGRPYASTEAFMSKLGTIMTPEETQTAAMYIDVAAK